MIRLRALGRCVVEVGDQRVTPESDVLFALLLYVSSSAGRAVPRAVLLDLLWPGSSVASARHRLRQALYQLKRMGVPFAAEDAAVLLRESDVEVDYLECIRVPELLVRAVGGGGIQFLPRYAPTFSPVFARWVEDERDRVRSLLCRALSEQIMRARPRGDEHSIASLARACLEVDPLNSDATLALAESLAVLGNRAEALAVLDRYRLEALAGTEDELSQAHTALRRRIIALARKPRAETGQAPIVGRSETLVELNAWIAGGVRAPRVYAFSGEAGIGKSRLVGEGTRIAILRGTRCIEYRPSAAGDERPLAGLLDLLPQLLALPGAVGCAPESYARLTNVARGNEVDRSIPEDSTDSAFRFATLRRSIFDLVEAIVSEGDLLVSIDDAHTLDRPTLEILVDATRCKGHRLALLLAFRPTPGVATFLAGQHDVRLVHLGPLDAIASRAILAQHLSAESAAKQSQVIDWAVDLANGNPFFLAELSTHFLTQSGYGSLPPSLQIALGRKIEALSSTPRLMVQACAVLGEHSTLDRLERMLAVPPHAMASALAELELAGLIAMRHTRVVCRHDLIGEAVLRSVTGAFGSYLHRRCAIVLEEELQTSAAASMAWETASHWGAADDHARALEVTGRIIDQLLSLGLPQEAADLCIRSERYCTSPEQQAERLLKLSRAQRLLYDWDGVVNSLTQRRAALAGSKGPIVNKYSEDEIAVFEARWWRRCDGQVLRPAIQRVTDTKAPTLHRLQMAVLALIVTDNQHRKQQAEGIAEIVEGLQTHSAREDVERAKARLIYHTAFGSLDEALVAGNRIVEAERRTGNSAALLKALRWASIPQRLTNNIDSALLALREAYELASKLGLRAEMWNAVYYIEGVALDSEDVELALEWVPLVADLADHAIVHALRASDHDYFRARIEFMRGDLEKARRFLDLSSVFNKSLPAARGEQSVLALDVMLRTRGERRPIPHRSLERLRVLHLKTRDSGILDFETAAIVAGLLYANRGDEAYSLYSHYMRHRRSRIAAHSTLQSVEAQLRREGFAG